MELSERQNQIVTAAVELIAAQGIQKLTMKRIAESIGVTEPAVYRHFPNKKAILLAVLDSFDAVRARLLEESDGEPGAVRLEHFVLGLFDLCVHQPSLARVLFAEEFFQSDPQLSQRMFRVMHTHRDRLVTLIREAQVEREIRNDIPPLQAFRIVIGPVRLLVTQWCMSGHAFDLRIEGDEVWSALKRVLHP